MSKYKAIINLVTDAIVVVLLSMFAFVPLKNTKPQETISNTITEKTTKEENSKKTTVIGEDTSLKLGVSLLIEQVRPHF